MKYKLLPLMLTLLLACCTSQAQIQWKWTPVTIDSTMDDIRDLRATEIIAKYAPQVAPLQEIVAYSQDEYDKGRPESGLSNFAADVIYSIAEQRTGRNVDIAMTNFGGIRTSLPKGAVRVYDIFSIFPFDNSLVVFDIKGSDLHAFLDRMIGRGRVECLSGVEIEIRDRKATKLNVAGAPIDDSKVYTFATINFLMDGGDGLTLTDMAFNREDTGIWVRDAICDYLRALTARGETLTLAPDGRIKDHDRKERR